MRRSRVLIAIKGLGIGGAEMLLVNSIPHLDRDTFEYELAYLLPWKHDLAPRFLEAGIPVHQVGGDRGNAPAAIGDLRRLVEEREIDLIDAHLPVTGVVARLANRGPGRVPLVYHEHSLSVQRRLSKGRFLGFVANVASYGMNDVIVTVSEDTARDVRRFNPSKTPVRVVLNGIPLPSNPPCDTVRAALAALGVPEDHLVVGHVAKMVSKKRQQDLVLAASEVIRQLPKTTFLLVGQGPRRSRLERMVQRLGLTDRIRLPGFVEDLLPAMAGFDVFALSSLHEGLPTVTIEAAALGVPVVATQVGGTPEVVEHEESGFLVPPRDPHALAGALVRLLTDTSLRNRMSAAAVASAQRFDIRRRVRELEQVYADLLEISPRPSRA